MPIIMLHMGSYRNIKRKNPELRTVFEPALGNVMSMFL